MADALFPESEMTPPAPSGAAAPYLVLARKYRPSSFATLIGQDAMVQTLRNAFRTGRIPHAFMLTGIRGVGKTTTARILARAVNFEDGSGRRPNLDLVTSVKAGRRRHVGRSHQQYCKDHSQPDSRKRVAKAQ